MSVPEKVVDNVILHFSRGNSMMGDFEIFNRFAEHRKLIYEIGTAYGISTMMLAHGGADIVTVDNHTFYLNDKYDTPVKKHKVISEYLSLFSNGRIETVLNDSVKEADNRGDGTGDLIFIDGGHDFDQVLADYTAWFPKLKLDGVFLFHDCDPATEGVWKFYKEILVKDDRIRELLPETIGKTVTKVFVKEKE